MSTLGAIGAAAALPGCEDEPAEPPRTEEVTPPRPALRNLDATHALALDAMLDALLPRGEGRPGARDTGVLVYVDRQLGEPAFAGFQRLVRDGLQRLDAWARSDGATSFDTLTPEARVALLGRVQRGETPGRFPSARFFAIVHTFALEGHLGDPRHGGNQDRRGWQWLAIDPSCGTGMHHGCGGG